MNAELFARKVRHIMVMRGLSQREVVRLMNSSFTTVSAVCNGRVVPKVEVIERLADALQVPLAVLIHDGTLEDLEPYKPALDLAKLPGDGLPKYQREGKISA